MNQKAVVLGIIILIILVGAGVYIATTGPLTVSPSPQPEPSARVSRLPLASAAVVSPSSSALATAPPSFTAIKSAHFVSSQPANNEIVSSGLTSVKINFNFDLAAGSEIAVAQNGVAVTSGATAIAADKLSLTIPINATPPGNYVVTYTACWPDKSCHGGSFGFVVQ